MYVKCDHSTAVQTSHVYNIACNITMVFVPNSALAKMVPGV